MKVLDLKIYSEKLGIKPLNLSDIDKTKSYQHEDWYIDLKGRTVRCEDEMIEQFCTIHSERRLTYSFVYNETANAFKFFAYLLGVQHVDDLGEYFLTKANKRHLSTLDSKCAYYRVALELFGPVKSDSSSGITCYEIVKYYHDLLTSYGLSEFEMVNIFTKKEVNEKLSINPITLDDLDNTKAEKEELVKPDNLTWLEFIKLFDIVLTRTGAYYMAFPKDSVYDYIQDFKMLDGHLDSGAFVCDNITHRKVLFFDKYRTNLTRKDSDYDIIYIYRAPSGFKPKPNTRFDDRTLSLFLKDYEFKEIKVEI